MIRKKLFVTLYGNSYSVNIRVGSLAIFAFIFALLVSVFGNWTVWTDLGCWAVFFIFCDYNFSRSNEKFEED